LSMLYYGREGDRYGNTPLRTQLSCARVIEAACGMRCARPNRELLVTLILFEAEE
jgi:hypothetical protein